MNIYLMIEVNYKNYLKPLPDGTGVTYQTCVNLDCYLPGQTLTNINDFFFSKPKDVKEENETDWASLQGGSQGTTK